MLPLLAQVLLALMVHRRYLSGGMFSQSQAISVCPYGSCFSLLTSACLRFCPFRAVPHRSCSCGPCAPCAGRAERRAVGQHAAQRQADVRARRMPHGRLREVGHTRTLCSCLALAAKLSSMAGRFNGLPVSQVGTPMPCLAARTSGWPS